MMIPGLGHTLNRGPGGAVPSFPTPSPPTTAQLLPTLFSRAPPKPLFDFKKGGGKKSPTSMVVRILQLGMGLLA